VTTFLANLPVQPEHILTIFTSTLKMETTCSSETVVPNYNTKQCHNREYHYRYTHHENLPWYFNNSVIWTLT
jgi:hypothetical protein